MESFKQLNISLLQQTKTGNNDPSCLDMKNGKDYLVLDFDISTDDELISGYVLIVILFFLLIFQGIIVRKTAQCMRNKQSSLKYLLIVQITSILTILCQFISLLLLTSYFFYIKSNSSDFNQQNFRQSSLFGVLTAYDVIQTLSVLLYLLTFFLALYKWLEILKITSGTKSNIKILRFIMYVIFIPAFILMTVNIILISVNQQLQLDHYFISGCVLLSGGYTVYVTYHLSKNIEYIYEIDYSFKKRVKQQLYVLIFTCLLRGIFNLTLMVVDIKCYKFDGPDDRLQNPNIGWSIVLPFLVLANNSAAIVFSILFSPGKKFRQNLSHDNYHSLSDDN
ncbi:transmembrane protein, putative (macronuclear) [Tetrahymena thermophila SB210]|uniref:Transmembrane protein, putative n=1 Tax=Tetrahymena thermophila (strain SB210) TaxID=312017 RepID=W7XHZ5_TETTS|nr:transmembrane protein, putative [Tetrahymena thermophila SB210]EWS72844.1 transmembrane protein, putative [Tetrahymena thermophila SB210]|eukprot:XP_012654617.1 transmembrane protein, putative [Tetrahymena thermophila SB210]